MNIAALVSGGVDSSVAVHLLVEAGYKPTLFYIQIGMEDEHGNVKCEIEDDVFMCRFLAKKYALPFEMVSLQKEYWDYVVKYTIQAVKRGLTPNPDMMCNRLIKFGCFEEKWGKNFNCIATGHYASSTLLNNKIFLSTANDPVKDQTDFLAQITYPQLSKIMFPIGHLLKSEVREIAVQAGLPTANRKDSQGICFLGKIHYNDFIKRYLGVNKGAIIDFETGKILGEHEGYWFHTIGQRRGLRLGGGPWFVVKKDIENNIIYASNGYDPKSQYGNVINLTGFQFITENIFGELNRQPITFKIRHTPDFTPGYLSKIGDIYRIESDAPVSGIAAGQFGVVYDSCKKLCLGSGEIVIE